MKSLGAVLVLSGLSLPFGQVAPPDIRGQWDCVGCVRDSLDPALRPAFGSSPLITIEPMLVKITFDFPARGRGGLEERAAHVELALNGDKSNESLIASGASRTRWWDITTIESGRLVVESFEFSGNLPAHKTRRREVFLDQEGQLVVETRQLSSGRQNEPVAAPVRTVYRRRAQ